jgi:hypothetical protein
MEWLRQNWIKHKGETHMSELLTVREVARIFRVDDTTVRRWIKQGVLEAVPLPHVSNRVAHRVFRRTVDNVINPLNNV